MFEIVEKYVDSTLNMSYYRASNEKGGYETVMVIMAEAGIKAGIELVREIISMRVVSKYRMARDLGVSDTQVYNWLKGHSFPNEKNYLKLKEYRLYIERKGRLKFN